MNDILTPVRSLDQDRLFTTAEADLSRLTPAERLTLRWGSWLVLRAGRRLDRAPATDPLRAHARDEYVADARDRVLVDALLLGCVRTF